MHRESEEDRKASSDNSEDRETKPNDPRHKRSKFASNNNIGRTNKNMQSGQRTSSGSDSGEQEESRHTSHYRQGKGSHLDDEENALKNVRLYTNDDEQTSKTVTRRYEIEESHGTSRLLNREGKTSTNDRSITKEKQSDTSKDYSVQRKDWQTQHAPHHKDDKKNANRESSDREQQEKYGSHDHEGQGRVKHQGTPLGKRGHRRRSRSRGTDSDRSTSADQEKNRKSHHHRHHHRHHHKRKKHAIKERS